MKLRHLISLTLIYALCVPAYGASGVAGLRKHNHASDAQGGAIGAATITGATITNAVSINVDGALTSDKACGSGYSRKTPNFCWRGGTTGTSLTRDTCTTVAAETGATMVLVFVTNNVNGGGSAGTDHSTFVSFYDTSDCSGSIVSLSAVVAREFDGVTEGNTYHQTTTQHWVPVTSGNFYVRLSDDAANDGSGNYRVIGYMD